MGIDVVKCGGELFIDNKSMHRTAFCILSELSPLSRRKAHKLASMPSKNTMATARKMRGTTAGCVVSVLI